MSARSQIGVTWTQAIIAFAIVFIVAAVIYPVFQPVREGHGDSRSGCASNLNQLGLALIQYTQDSDDKLPSGVNAAGNGWAGALYPFTKSTAVYQCPDDKQQGSYISYAENRNIVKKSYSDFSNPTATVTLYETTTLNCNPATPESVSTTGISAPQNSKRHNDNFGLNFLAVDGHVQYLKPGQVSGGPNAVSAKTLPQGSYLETFAIK